MENVVKVFSIITDQKGKKRFWWEVSGERGGVHLWLQEPNDPEVGYYGGIETHYALEPEDSDCYCFREHCEVTGGKCWHSGSSLYVEEQVLHDFDPDASFESMQEFFYHPEKWYMQNILPCYEKIIPVDPPELFTHIDGNDFKG